MDAKKDFCFCTFASSPIYRSLAKLLASDLEKYAPGTPFLIFTDRPGDFVNCSNVLVFKHKQQGILCYHERRFAIAKALSMFNSCIYLDADLRINSPVPPDMQWLPGITARSCTNMKKHIQSRLNKTNPPRLSLIKEFEFYKKMAKKIDLDIEDERIVWLNEFLFVITKDAGKEVDFLNYWGKLALYAELNGYHNHPAYAIGLAAAHAGLTIRYNVMEGLEFFDDRIEKVRISKEQANPDTKKIFFEEQKRIENSHRSIPLKIMNKFLKLSHYGYHSIRLKGTTLIEDYEFYYK